MDPDEDHEEVDIGDEKVVPDDMLGNGCIAALVTARTAFSRSLRPCGEQRRRGAKGKSERRCAGRYC